MQNEILTAMRHTTEHHIADICKVSLPSTATVYAWLNDWSFFQINEQIQEMGITLIVMGNAFYLLYKLYLLRRDARWEKQDRKRALEDDET